MADVQVEHGHVRIANELYEALMRVRMPGRHKDVVHAVLRLTWGYQKSSDTLAASQVGDLIGVDPRDARRMLANLADWGVLERTDRPGRKPTWAIQKDYDHWQIGRTRDARRARPSGFTGQEGSAHPGECAPRSEGSAHPAQEGSAHPVQRGAHTPPSGDTEEGSAHPGGRGAHTPEKRGARTPLQRKKDILPKTERGALRAPAPDGASKPKAARKRPGTPAPDDLTGEQWADLEQWASEKEPWAIAQLRDLVDGCLGHFRGSGGLKADWYATVQTWIRNERTKYGARSRASPARQMAQTARRHEVDVDGWQKRINEGEGVF